MLITTNHMSIERMTVKLYQLGMTAKVGCYGYVFDMDGCMPYQTRNLSDKEFNTGIVEMYNRAYNSPCYNDQFYDEWLKWENTYSI
ncbi:hypothetical protein NUACC26_085700 [Scytonema sp. NUACC26]